MRRIMLVMLLTAVFLIVGTACSQDQIPPGDSGKTTVVYAGVRSSDGKILFSVGAGKNLAGGLYLLPYADVGYAGSLNAELAYFIPMTKFVPIDFLKELHIGVLAGPNVDWRSPDTDWGDPITYIVGAAGGVAAIDFGGYGLWGYYKYKFSTDDNFYQDGTHFGGGAVFWL